MRFVLVPASLLSMPQQFAVLVNSCAFTMTSSGTNPASTAHGTTASSSRTLPLRTSPTSNATWPPPRTIRCSSTNTWPIACCHASTVRAIVIGTALLSMPQNQQRSQLSSAYCTTSRNGGDVTTSCTLASANCGISCAGPVVSTASRARACDSFDQ